ncbi:MAG TPA: nucleoside 2-deoxyribosyltransferase [Acetobacteraceae bacterium]|jgi:nucleoside 2-deoxyribosyltransferase|nr:nucleoside 2-deoxyribosyltransferase [Acetobacteraceae bacterium]
MKIYLAGPVGFSAAGRDFHDHRLIPELEQAGHTVLDPWKLTDPEKVAAVRGLPSGPDRREAWRVLNPEIGRSNHAGLDRCDAVVAVLDGVDVDSGTASEIGYAFARGKPIVGYRGDLRLSADNEALTVNLQVEYFIRASSGDIVSTLDQLSGALAGLKLAQ